MGMVSGERIVSNGQPDNARGVSAGGLIHRSGTVDSADTRGSIWLDFIRRPLLTGIISVVLISACGKSDSLLDSVDTTQTSTDPSQCVAKVDEIDPIILFIPGYTGPLKGPLVDLLAESRTRLNKKTYYESQRDFFRGQGASVNPPHPNLLHKERSYIYLNHIHGGFYNADGALISPNLIVDATQNDLNSIGFNSDAEIIVKNAKGIAWVLTELKRCRRKATIVSHSKGGQDVLHALAVLPGTMESLDELAQGNPSFDACGAYSPAYMNKQKYLAGKQLWDTVEGWVAFTSNHLESQFRVNMSDQKSRYEAPICPDPFRPFQDCNRPGNTCPVDVACNYHSNIFTDDWDQITGIHDPRAPFQSRLNYMHNNRKSINQLLRAVPTASLYANYDPGGSNFSAAGALDLTNRGMRREARDVIFGEARGCGRGNNDGLVPVRAGRLFGAYLIEELANDPASNKGSNFCGADHLAPVVTPNDLNFELWTPRFRDKETQRYIKIVEDVERGVVIAEAAKILGNNCYFQAPDNLLNATDSISIGKAGNIVKYEWFEQGSLIAEGETPKFSFGPGEHTVTLQVTTSCGLIGNDEVSFHLGLDCPAL